MKLNLLFASIFLVILGTIMLAKAEVPNNQDTHVSSRQRRAAPPLCTASGKDVGCDNHCRPKNQYGKCTKDKCVCKGPILLIG